MGTVGNNIHPTLRLVVLGPEGPEQAVDAKIDTGFSFYLTLPPAIIAALNLTLRRKRDIILATGTRVGLEEYAARVVWEGIERPIRVLATDGDPLVGVAMFYGYRLCVDVVEGGGVSAEALMSS